MLGPLARRGVAPRLFHVKFMANALNDRALAEL
jgi:hypothetical protein